jgi:isopentenyldiphosphate isomerase
VRDFPGKLDISAAGHVRAGERYDDAARRELQEELRVEVAKLVPLFKEENRVEEELSPHRTNRECQRIFWASLSDSLEPRPNPVEVEAAFWVYADEVFELLRGARLSPVIATRVGGRAAGKKHEVTLDDFIPTAHDYVRSVFSMLLESKVGTS